MVKQRVKYSSIRYLLADLIFFCQITFELCDCGSRMITSLVTCSAILALPLWLVVFQ